MQSCKVALSHLYLNLSPPYSLLAFHILHSSLQKKEKVESVCTIPQSEDKEKLRLWVVRTMWSSRHHQGSPFETDWNEIRISSLSCTPILRATFLKEWNFLPSAYTFSWYTCMSRDKSRVSFKYCYFVRWYLLQGIAISMDNATAIKQFNLENG